MTAYLAHIVANAHISRLSLVGLAKNVGKTTTTNHLVATLLGEQLYRADELALTSLGLDGEAIDALTGLPKPRYVPEAGMLVATTATLLLQAESEGARIERLRQLPGRTALGAVLLARIQHPGRIIIAGPTLLRDLRGALDQLHTYGARLGIVDGAINRLGAAAPGITDACILCTGASLARTPELAARRTVDALARLSIQQSTWADAYRKYHAQQRLLLFSPERHGTENLHSSGSTAPAGTVEPADEARWIAGQIDTHDHPVCFLRGALTEELSRALLAALPPHFTNAQGELVVEDGTKVFCHSVTLQRLAARGLMVRVARSIRVLAMTLNPYTPEYACTPRRLLDALLKELPEFYPPLIDVVSGMFHARDDVTS